MTEQSQSPVQVILKKGREKSVQQFHPWIFSGAIDRVEGEFQPGGVVDVFSSAGTFLGRGLINPNSQIRVRILTFRDQPVDAQFFTQRIRQATKLRQRAIPPQTNAYRLVYGDGDFLSGWVVDKYAQSLVVQFHSMGMERRKSMLIDILTAEFSPKMIVERSDSASRREEGLAPEKKIHTHQDAGETTIQIEENGIKFWVDVWNGQKTGFYLDQRENRQRLASFASHQRVLNCFSYTGAFSVYAALQKARTTSVEISEEAQHLARENFRLNGLNPEEHQFVIANVFDYLRESGDPYDVIVLDPPAFVKKKVNLKAGARGYQDINRLAMQKLAPNGILLTCSCSHHLNWVLFQQILFSAAAEARREIQIIGRFGQPADHPINIFHPESEYLKTFLLRVI